jgi:hypothetical protein
MNILFLIALLQSCGGGGESSQDDPSPANIIITHSSLPSQIFSYQPIELNISSNYPTCSFDISSPSIFWKESSGNNFKFNAPISFQDEENFSVNINSIGSSNCPSGQKNIELTVKRFNTKYSAEPSNTSELLTDFYHIADIGFGGINITERFSATICYPTPDDCITSENELFGQDAHNMATGDFNNDGFEDLVVAWAIFPHTIEESQKIDAPINVYLNDGYGHLLEDISIYSSGVNPTHPFAYRLGNCRL